MTDNTTAIELDRVTLRLGARTVLDDVSFAIRPGEFIGVLGPNGAGKTTLMRAILGLLPPSAGALRVFGHEPRRGDHQIGYLPQVRTVLPDLRLRGRDFIAASLNGERWGLPVHSHADRAMIGETLALVGAEELAERPLSAMSGGERQRLLLAQALIGRPRLLLLDEPLISLDARHQEIAIDVVRRAASERGITVLFSAHELNQLVGTLDRVLYLGNTPGGARHRRRGDHRAGAVGALRHRHPRGARGRPHLRHGARPRRRTCRASARARAWASSLRRTLSHLPWRGG